jgi:hypothetical protein
MTLDIVPVLHTGEVVHWKALNSQDSELSGSLIGEKNTGPEPTVDET